MKFFGKTFKILFNSAEEINRSNGTMSKIMTDSNFERVKRHQRKLPQLPRGTLQKTFWTTFRTAEHWMAKNHQSLDHALDLLELYPDLIKQPFCDRLWDFINRTKMAGNEISKTEISCTTNLSSRTESVKDKTCEHCGGSSVSDVNKASKKLLERRTNNSLSVPEILVSHPQDEEFFETGNHPKSIYICGNMEDDSWHRLLVGLSGEYAVRCFAPNAHDISKWLCDTDVFVFLMDDTSVHDSVYRSQLSMAIMFGKTIVYVRDLGFELPDMTVGDSAQNVGNGSSKTSQTSATSQPKKSQKTRASKQLGVQNHSTESLENDGESNDENTVTNSTIIEMDSIDIPVLTSRCGRISPPPRCHMKQKNDILKTFESEYGTALVYHQLYHQRCLERIVSTINAKGSHCDRSRSTSFSKDRRFLNTPFSGVSLASSYSNDSAIGDVFSEHMASPEPEMNIPSFPIQNCDIVSTDFTEYIFDDISSLSSASDTVYLVSPDPESGNCQPKIFHYPKDVKSEVMANSPSIDSFDFHDIDLSKRLNEIDLFDGDLSD